MHERRIGMDIRRAREALFSGDETMEYSEREDALDAFLQGNVPDEQAERYVRHWNMCWHTCPPQFWRDSLVMIADQIDLFIAETGK